MEDAEEDDSSRKDGTTAISAEDERPDVLDPPKSSSEVSAVLAQKMLEGWKLLETTCPMPGCLVPLVENKARERYCARCGVWLSSTGESPVKAKKDRDTSTSPVKARASTGEASADTPSGSNVAKLATAVPSTSNASVCVAAAASLLTISEKMEEARQWLTASADVGSCHAVAALLAQYAEAAHSLQKLRVRNNNQSRRQAHTNTCLGLGGHRLFLSRPFLLGP